MADILKYRAEFDTIKNRKVRVDIEEYRDLSSRLIIPGVNYIQFIKVGSINNIIFTASSLDVKAGDQIIISDTFPPGNRTVNDGTYDIISVIKAYLNTVDDVDFFLYTVRVTQNVVNENPTLIYVNFNAAPPLPVINLTASGQSPLTIEYPNGKFDKMCPIRESKLRFKILNKNVSYEDFIIERDNQYKIKVYISDTFTFTNANLEWVGWLDNDYVTEPFLDTFSEIELSANDGLNLLKTIKLKSIDDSQMWGFFRIKEYIANCLYRTGLDLYFYSFINMYPENALTKTASPPSSYDWDAFYYSQIYAHAFLKSPRDFDDCYEVLSKIMQAFGCTLYQARGAWYILQTNDRVRNLLDGNERDQFGEATNNILLNQSYQINVGLNKNTKLINADALVSVEKKFKEVAITHKFDTPPAYFRNFDLLDVVNNEPSYWTGAPTSLASFYNYVNQSNVIIDVEPTTGVEVNRYLSLQGRTLSGGNSGAKRSTLYPVNKGDRIKLSFSCKSTILYPAGAYRIIAHVLFTRFDGVLFYLKLDGSWVNTVEYVGKVFFPSTSGLWADYNIDSLEIPDNGQVSIVLSGLIPVSGNSLNNFEVHFNDLEFEIQTSYNELITVDGVEFKSKNYEILKNVYDNEIFISYAPNISTQGSLLNNLLSNNNIQNWKHYSETNNELVPFGRYITRSYWRTMYRNFIRMEGRLYNIYDGNHLVTPLNTILFDGINDKEFMITTLLIDLRQEAAEFTSIELRYTDNENDTNENGIESFRYLNGKAKDPNDPLKMPKTPLDWKYGNFGLASALINRNRRRRLNNF